MRTVFVYSVLVIVILACNNDDVNWQEDTAFRYLPRACEYASASHNNRIDMGVKTGISEFNNTYSIEPLNGKKVVANDYLLNVSLGSITSEMTTKPDFNPDDYLAQPDLIMEQQLKQYLEQSNSNASSSHTNNMYTNLVDVEYRLTELKNIKVTSTTKLFDREAGDILNDKLEIYSAPAYHHFLFTHDKQLIGSIQQGWSLKEYLSYRPIASASLYLRFISTPVETPLETSFIIEMEMANGEILRDTTEIVNLLP
ncbi:MAG: hypothetical protein MI866_09320 [Bacteroidales bacterium]|nr:hypothetical protein [Bacteroidales bacterium]